MVFAIANVLSSSCYLSRDILLKIKPMRDDGFYV